MGRKELEDEIRKRLAEGFEVTVDDLEGWSCAYCGDIITFEDIQNDPDAVKHLDVPVEGTGEGGNGYYHRHHFCPDECRDDAMGDMDWMLGEDEDIPEPDTVHSDDVDRIYNINNQQEWSDE